VRTLQFAAVRTFVECFNAQRIVAAAHAALGGRSLALGDSLVGTLFRIISSCTTGQFTWKS
jgi:hypothetical protein